MGPADASAIRGTVASYHRLPQGLTPVFDSRARRGLARAGQPVDHPRTSLQDILLAVSSESGIPGRQCAVRAVAVCDPLATSLRFAASVSAGGFFRQHRRFRRNDPGEPPRDASAREVAASFIPCARQREYWSQAISVYSASIKVPPRICDERGTRSGWRCIAACQPPAKLRDPVRMETDQLFEVPSPPITRTARILGRVLCLTLALLPRAVSVADVLCLVGRQTRMS